MNSKTDLFVQPNYSKYGLDKYVTNKPISEFIASLKVLSRPILLINLINKGLFISYVRALIQHGYCVRVAPDAWQCYILYNYNKGVRYS